MRATAAPTAMDVELRGEAAITLAAGTEGGGPPTFNMMVYGGGPIRPMLDPPLPYPVVIDLAGMDLSKQMRPALKDHDEKKLVGHTSAITSDGRQLTATGIVSGTGDAAAEVLGAAKNGFKWPVSIGAGLKNLEFVGSGKTVTVNAQSVSGPLFIARASRPREISFLTVAADDDAVATIAAEAAKGEVMDFATWLKANGFLSEAELNASQLTMLKAAFNRSKGIVLEAGEKSYVETMVTAAADQPRRESGSGDLDTIIKAERAKENQRKEIVNLTAKALQDYPGQLTIIEALSRQAIAGEWETSRYELELLRATRPQAGQYRRVNSADDGLNDKVVEAALCLAGGIEQPEKLFSEQTLEAASRRWRHGLGLGELLMMFARRAGQDIMSTRNPGPLLRAAFGDQGVIVTASGVSTLSLPGILSNVANKFLRMGFDAVESTWRQVASIRPVKDFKQSSSYSLTGDFSYVLLAPGGKLEHAAVGEETYTNQADTYGRMFGIDRRDIINDDLGALTQVPRRLGRGAALKFNGVFWTEFLADHTSNGTFFPTNGSKGDYIAGATAGNGTDSRLNVDGLSYAEQKFFDQTDPNTQPLGITPQILLVPNSLNAVGSALTRSLEVRGTTTTGEKLPVDNPHAGKFTLVRSSYLSNSAMGGAYSAKFWYLLANPNDLSFIEVAFLNGVETPTVETADADFNSLGIQMRGYHDFGVNKQEYRAAVKSKGEA